MIDLHSHVIFGVDDGPKTIEESLALIDFSYKQGVREIVATSHRRKGMFETPEEIIKANYQLLKDRLSTTLPDLSLHFGAEIYYTSDVLAKLEDKSYPTLAETQIVLVEFSGGTPWKEIHKALSNLLMQGLTPLVAHIERYDALGENMDHLKELISMGCYTQVNSSHVLKPKLFGDPYKVYKKRAKRYLDNNLVHCISSDMHNLDKRPPYMKEAYEIIGKTYGKERAYRLFEGNAKQLLENTLI